MLALADASACVSPSELLWDRFSKYYSVPVPGKNHAFAMDPFSKAQRSILKPNGTLQRLVYGFVVVTPNITIAHIDCEPSVKLPKWIKTQAKAERINDVAMTYLAFPPESPSMMIIPSKSGISVEDLNVNIGDIIRLSESKGGRQT